MPRCLSIRPDDDARWLLACHSGCAFDVIFAALRLEAHGFGPDADPPSTVREQALHDCRRNVPALTLLVATYGPSRFATGNTALPTPPPRDSTIWPWPLPLTRLTPPDAPPS